MKTAILFDLDGTLLNTLEDIKDGVNYALSKLGYPPRTLEEVRRFVGNGAGVLMKQAVPAGGDGERALEIFQSYYPQHCRIKTAPYPGIPEALELLSREYPLAIVSNKPDAAVKPLCAAYFPGVYARGESADCPRKPAPDMVRRAMEAVGADTCVYVGDSEVDVLTAANAGVPCLSVVWGFRGKAELAAAGGKHFCKDPRELISAVRQLIREEEGSQNGK